MINMSWTHRGFRSTLDDMNLSVSTAPVSRPTSSGGSGRVADTASAAVAPIVWGTTYLVTTELLPPDHPFFAGLMRALPAGLAAVLITSTLPRGVWWWRSLVLGALSVGFFFPMLFVAAERLPGGVAATFGAVQPIIVAVLAVRVLAERPTVRRFAWGAAGLAGVALVVLGPDAALDPIGVLAGIGGAASMAVGVVLAKRWGRPAGVGPVAYAGWQLTAGGLVLLPLTAVIEGSPPQIDAPAVGGYLWLGLVGGLVAYVLWFRGIQALPVTSVAMLGLLSPIVAAVLGAAVLGESFGAVQFAGFLLALVAIVGSQLPHRSGR
jgi:probable blue pigment (indigoidine) exporter